MKLEEFPPDSMEKQKPQEGFGGKWVGAGEEPVWVPQKPSPPPSSGFHKMEEWQYF